MSQAHATTIIWGNTATNFNSGASWSGGSPSSTKLGSFQATTAAYYPQLTGDASILGLSFASGTASWVFWGDSGTRNLTIYGSGIVSNAASSQVFSSTNLSLALGAAQSFTSNSSGALYIDAPVSNGGNLLTLKGTSTNTANYIGGVISGTGGLTKAGSGFWALAGANTYTGDTNVTAGTLQIRNQTASPTINISAGATLDLNTASNRNNSTSTTFTGSGTLVKSGTGTVLWGTSVATFSLGAGSLIDVQAGTFTGGSFGGASAENWTNNLSSLNIAAGATFNGGATAVYVDALTGAGTLGWGWYSIPTSFTMGVNNGSGTFSGVIQDFVSGAATNYASYVKVGTGTQVLSGSNTYTGTTTIDAGTLNIQNSNALGSTAGSTTVASGATLALQGGISVGAEALTLSGTGAAGNGALANVSGNNTYAGAITLNAASQIQSDAGTITLSGGIGGTGQNLTFAGAGNSTVSGAIATGTGSVTKTGSGTVTLSGTTANTFTGGLNVNDGTLNLNKSAGINAVGANSTLTVGDSIGSALSANLNVQASNLLPASTTLVLNSDGRLGLGTATASVSTIAGTGQIDLGTTGTLVVGASNASSSFGGSLTGSGTLEKSGTGTLTLTSDVSAASATLNLNGGTLKLSGINLDLGTLDITGNSTIDFSGVSGTLSVGNLNFLSSSFTLNIINWNSAVTYFYATNWAGAVYDATGALPMNQVVFNPSTYTGNDTIWDSYDNQIRPIPEPTTYGAVCLVLCSAFLLWRRRRSTKAQPAA